MEFAAPVQRTKMFQSIAQFYTRDKEWLRIADASEKSIEDQFNEWADKEKPHVVSATAAPLTIAQVDADHVMFIYVKYVYYLPAYVDNQSQA